MLWRNCHFNFKGNIYSKSRAKDFSLQKKYFDIKVFIFSQNVNYLKGRVFSISLLLYFWYLEKIFAVSIWTNLPHNLQLGKCQNQILDTSSYAGVMQFPRLDFKAVKITLSRCHQRGLLNGVRQENGSETSIRGLKKILIMKGKGIKLILLFSLSGQVKLITWLQ